MGTIVTTPAISKTDDSVMLAEWLCRPGEVVRKGQAICAIENAKASLELAAEDDGYLHPLVAAGERIAVGAPLAALTESPGEDPAALLGGAVRDKAAAKRWTKKAALTARRLGIDIAALAARHPGKVLGEDDVLAEQAALKAPGAGAFTPTFESAARRPEDLLWDRFAEGRPERILLLGGGAGAGIVVLDALSRLVHQRAVGILDRNPASHGKTVAGVPVLGPLERAEALWREGFCDSAIILFSDSLSERETLFESLRAKGVPFANIVDPTTQLRGHVRMGQGNLILGNGFLAACVSIGDNNFFLSHTCIEHHATIGSHCVFGPRLTTTGYVTVEDRVRIGMCVALEPHVRIGSDSSIASGCVITRDVPPSSLVKAQQSYLVRPRQPDEID